MEFYALVIIVLGIISGVTCTSTPYMVQRHKMFINVFRANETYTYYQHRAVVNHMIQIPCFLEGENLTITSTDPVSYEWLMNGRQIRTHTAFVHATWDVEGNLTLLATMIRQTTLWCHARLEDTQQNKDFYFAHQINFYEEPVHQVLISVYINLSMPKQAIEQKCKFEENTCDCRKESGKNATEQRFRPGLKTHAVKDSLYQAALNVCQHAHYCQTLSLDDFQCLNDEIESTSEYHAEISFFLDAGRHFYSQNTWYLRDTSQMKTELEIKLKANSGERCDEFKTEVQRQMALEVLSCDINTSSVIYQFCMGPSSRLNRETEECELCPTGSYASGRLVSPAPPRIEAQYQKLLSDHPYLIEKHATEAEVSDWLNREDATQCLPCPSNTYAEELGRMVCLPCPVWHMMPENLTGSTHVYTGSNWLHDACPREGRAEVRLIQVSEAMLGRRFARWVHESSPLTRVGALLTVFLIPLGVAIFLLYVAYILIDVGATLVKMANQLHPLQVQIAETTTATAQFKAEFRRATEEAYQRLRGR